MPLFFRYLFVILCCYFIYSKLLKIKPYRHINWFFCIAFLCISAAFTSYVIHNAVGRIILAFLITYVALTASTKQKILLSFRVLLISYSLSYMYLMLSITIVGTTFVLFYKDADKIPYTTIGLPIGIVQFLFMYFSFKVRRFYNGIRILATSKNHIITLLFPVVFIAYIAIFSVNADSIGIIRTIINIFFLALAMFLLYYWRHRITQTYREKLRQANEKSMLDEINEHKLTIEKLTADNKRLASIVHADNKLIPAMLAAVTGHLENRNNLTLDELTAHGHELSKQLRSMAEDRKGILDSHPKDAASLPKSGLHTVDGMISFMETRAKENNVAYRLTIEDNIREAITNVLNEEDLLRLLGDLIDNAIIATDHTDKEKAILIHMGTLQDHFLLEISDSGIPFTIDTYQHFGNEQYTTHKDSGGSGIGLMDIWKIKKKYRASLHIYEFPKEHGIYTKKMSFVFDRKNHFLLQTDRYKEITRELTRGDLYVFPYKSE